MNDKDLEHVFAGMDTRLNAGARDRAIAAALQAFDAVQLRVHRAVDLAETHAESHYRSKVRPPRPLCAASPHPAARDQPSAVLRPSAWCSPPPRGRSVPFGRPGGH